MNRILLISAMLILIGCGKKPKPTPDVPEVPVVIEEVAQPVESVNDEPEDLSGVEIPVVSDEQVAVEIAPDAGAAIVTEGEEGETDEHLAKEGDKEETEMETESEAQVATQVVVDETMDYDQITPDSMWVDYMIKPADNLSLIALKEYGNANEWRRIYNWNREKIGDDPNMIHPYHYLDLLKPRENAIEWEYDYYIHRVTKGETLWTISRKEYGDEYAWVVLFWDNETLIDENNGILRPGMELKVRTDLWPKF